MPNGIENSPLIAAIRLDISGIQKDVAAVNGALSQIGKDIPSVVKQIQTSLNGIGAGIDTQGKKIHGAVSNITGELTKSTKVLDTTMRDILAQVSTLNTSFVDLGDAIRNALSGNNLPGGGGGSGGQVKELSNMNRMVKELQRTYTAYNNAIKTGNTSGATLLGGTNGAGGRIGELRNNIESVVTVLRNMESQGKLSADAIAKLDLLNTVFDNMVAKQDQVTQSTIRYSNALKNARDLRSQLSKAISTYDKQSKLNMNTDEVAIDIDVLRQRVTASQTAIAGIVAPEYDNVRRILTECNTLLEKHNQKLQNIKTPLEQAKEAYSKLKDAYGSADKAKGLDMDTSYWEDQAKSAASALESIYAPLKNRPLASLTEDEQKIVDLVNKAAIAQKEHNKNIDDGKNKTSEYGSILDKVYTRMVSMLKAAATRVLRNMFQEAVKYASEYYDLLNEIRLVTGMTEEQADSLGERYRELADDLKLTSIELAEAAVDLYRQGLNDQEVDNRLSMYAKFAKVAAVDTADATKIMTAAVNNFLKDGQSSADLAEEIADTYAYMGDATATSSKDIGVAMQKTAASANNVGLSFKKVASYLSTILAVTQEAPESVGTAMNSLISRYARITNTGMNALFEDEDGESVAVNDVAKALATVGIELYNARTGFADLGDVLDELGGKWNALNPAIQNYIATQFAGTRNMNRFLTLMQNYDESVRLYTESLDAAGTTEEKYQIRTESVASAQNNLKNSLEELYSVLDADVLKGAYNAAAWFVDNLAAGMDLMNGFPVVATGVVSALIAIAGAISKISTAATFAGKAVPLLGLIGAGVTLGTALVGGIARGIEQSRAEMMAYMEEEKERIAEANKKIADVQSISESLASLRQMGDEYMNSAEGAKEYADILDRVNTISPSLVANFGLQADGLGNVAQKAGEAANAMDALLKSARQDAFTASAGILSEDGFSMWQKEQWKGKDTNGMLTDPRKPTEIIENIRRHRKLKEYQEHGIEDVLQATYGVLDAEKIKAVFQDIDTKDMAFYDEYTAMKEKVIARFEEELAALNEAAQNAISEDSQMAFTEDMDAVSLEKAKVEAFFKQYDDAFEAMISVANEKSKGYFDAIVRTAIGYSEMENPFYDAVVAMLGEAGSAFYGVGDEEETKAAIRNMWNTIVSNMSEVPEDQQGLVLNEILNVLLGEGTITGETQQKIVGVFEALKNGTLEASTPTQEEVEEVETTWAQIAALIPGTSKEANLGESLKKITSSWTPDRLRESEKDAASEMITAFSKLDDEIQSALLDASPALRKFFDEIQTGGKDGVTTLHDLTQLIIQIREEADRMIASEGISSFVDAITKESDSNYAASTGYAQQLADMVAAYGSGNIDEIQAVKDVWNSLDDSMKQSIADTYPALISAFGDVIDEAQKFDKVSEWNEATWEGYQDGRKAVARFAEELRVAQKAANAKYFKDTYAAIKELKTNAIDASEAWERYYQEATSAAAANDEFEAAQKKISSGMEVEAEEIENLAEYLGFLDPEMLLANWDSVGPMIADAIAEGQSAIDALDKEIFIKLTGWSVADFSAIQNGLLSTQGMAQDVINTLIAMGQWKLETIDLPTTVMEYNEATGGFISKTAQGGATVLKYTGKGSPFSGNSSTKKSSGGKSSSGGGGGGGSSKQESKVQKMLDEMEKSMDNMEYRRDIQQLAQDIYEAEGAYQSLLESYAKEKQLIGEENSELKKNVALIEEQLEIKRAELATLKEGTDKYEEAASDIEALEEAHKEYSKQLLENEKDLYALDDAIEDVYDDIRQAEIDVYDMIQGVLEDIEGREEAMLEARADMENEVLDIIKQRYEEERDAAIETAEAKRDALQEEIDKIDELLNARKKLEEEQDTLEEIASLEAKIARISADPTRAKEAAELRTQLDDLRKERAWTLAEDEAEAQKKSVQNQIDSLDEYIQYVEDYYEDLFEHPQKLIAEMEEIMQQTDEEILAFLQENNEEYAAASAANQQVMVNTWQNTLDDMRGKYKNYSEEVEEILKMSNEEIIQWMKDNSTEYQEAGKAQAEAYVKEWTDKLDELDKAAKRTSKNISSYNYSGTTGSGSSSGSSGSGGGGGSTSGVSYTYGYKNLSGSWVKTASSPQQQTAFNNAKSAALSLWKQQSGPGVGEAVRVINAATMENPGSYIKKFKLGGIADYTGLAFLHGSKERPERILSAYQTELFEDLIDTLHAIRRINISIPTMPYRESGGFEGLNIENLVVQVGDLVNDGDYEEAGRKVVDAIYNEIIKGMPVGGIRK